MPNLTVPHVLTFLELVVPIGLAVASLYMRIPAVVSSIVNFRT